MEMKKLRALVLVAWTVGLMIESSSASFQDCYTKCFIFCMIEPSQTLCSCTTHCLKDCIFPETPSREDWNSDSIGFCKVGCAFTMCSSYSTRQKPNGDKVNSCVGACSDNCVKSFSLPLP